MIDRNNIPYNNQFPKFKFPDFEVEKLNNGTKVYFINTKKEGLSGFQILIKRGGYYDNTAGLTNITAQMLTRGTSKYSSEDIASMTEFTGAVLKTKSGYDETLISGVFLNQFLEKIIYILTDCFFDSQVPEEELNKVKNKQIATIMQQNTDINFLSRLAFNKYIFGNKGYGIRLSGNESTIKNITRNYVLDNYKQKILPAGFSIFLIGNFEKQNILTRLHEQYGQHSSISHSNNKKISLNKTGIALIDKPDSNQASIIMGRAIIDRKHPDLPYVQLVNTIFGGFFLSRINKILREEKGYTYGVHSHLDLKKHSSLHIISTNVNIDKAAESIEIIKNEFENLKTNPITEEEMKRASQYYIGSFLRGIETPLQITSLVRNLDSNELDSNYYDNFYEKITNVNLNELHDAVEKHFSDNKFAISIAGDLNITQKQMEKSEQVQILEIEN